MSRTAHHHRRTFRTPTPRTPHARTAGEGGDERPGGPWHALVLYGLRYDARERADAAREGRRAAPRVTRRAVAVYAFPRYQRDPSVGHWATWEERRARQRLRARVSVVAGLVNSTGDPYTADEDAADIPPARHRRGGLWTA
ncbi:hypothetical protein ACGFRB_31730 [Streptomyces sp. NPDC048718]|uniref:hypothetical protein n=1 Tax=Streptomyces sp. NPDC048718 TaxID=3365587 RepID=UPI003718C5C2